MNKDEIIKTIKFHCTESKRNLFELKEFNIKLSKEELKDLEDTYYYLEKNLIASLTNNAN